MTTLADLEFLTSPAGAALLAELAAADLSDAAVLPLLTRLRRRYTAEQAGAAVQMAQLRQRARAKFGDDADRLLFTAAALEQASDPQVRHYRSQGWHGQRVVDAGCGIGADALALAAAGAAVTGLDLDPVRVAIARHNAAALGLAARFEVADVREPLPPADMIFFDPARRTPDGARIYDVEAYLPPLRTVRGWHAPQIMVKLSPGVNLDQLAAYGGSVEFISVQGDLKEAVLHLGGESLPPRRATLLAGGTAYHWDAGGHDVTVTVREPRGWLVEPDPALLRAGLVQPVAAAIGGVLLDETIAYITTDHKPESPWLRAWQILDWMPFHLKKLRAYLRARDVGPLTVKKRGHALSPEELISRLKLAGTQSRTLVLTRYAGRPVVLICADYSGDAGL